MAVNTTLTASALLGAQMKRKKPMAMKKKKGGKRGGKRK